MKAHRPERDHLRATRVPKDGAAIRSSATPISRRESHDLGPWPRVVRVIARGGSVHHDPTLRTRDVDMRLRGRGGRNVERHLLAPVRHSVGRVDEDERQAAGRGVWLVSVAPGASGQRISAAENEQRETEDECSEREAFAKQNAALLPRGRL